MGVSQMNIMPFRNEFKPEKVINPISYCHDYLKNNPGTNIYVGCDSQNKGRHTVYVTAICFRREMRAVHVIYHKEKVERINKIQQRLWKECERVIEVANMLSNNGISIYQVELDYNGENGWESNKLADAGRGWLIGLGYNAAVKPENIHSKDAPEMVATRAADHIAVKG